MEIKLKIKKLNPEAKRRGYSAPDESVFDSLTRYNRCIYYSYENYHQY